MNNKNERQPFLLAYTIIYAILIITELVLVNLQDHHYIDLPRWLLFSPTIVILLSVVFMTIVKNIKEFNEEFKDEQQKENTREQEK